MADVSLDCKGLVCPLPVSKVQQQIRKMQSGQTIEVLADCTSFPEDIRTWCTKTDHALISINTVDGLTTAVVKI